MHLKRYKSMVSRTVMYEIIEDSYTCFSSLFLFSKRCWSGAGFDFHRARTTATLAQKESFKSNVSFFVPLLFSSLLVIPSNFLAAEHIWCFPYSRFAESRAKKDCSECFCNLLQPPLFRWCSTWSVRVSHENEALNIFYIHNGYRTSNKPSEKRRICFRFN